MMLWEIWSTAKRNDEWFGDEKYEAGNDPLPEGQG